MNEHQNSVEPNEEELASIITGSQLVPVGEVCPKCGAAARVVSGDVSLAWRCDSTTSNDYKINKRFHQSDECRIRELESIIENAIRFLYADPDGAIDKSQYRELLDAGITGHDQAREEAQNLASELTAANAKLTQQYRDLHSAIYAAPCEETWTDEEHDAAMKMLISIVADPEERWVDERNAGAETVARMILDGKSGERMNDGPIPQALEKVKRLTAELERVGRERDAAISLLGQYNSNQGGLRLNGKAIGWHRDPIAGFVAGIGGSKVIYPTILAAIRAALSLDQPADGGKGEAHLGDQQ